MLDARAAPPGDPTLRLYGIGPYASLLGRNAAPLLGSDLDATATVDAQSRYDTIIPDAPVAWWPLISGWVGIRERGVPLAVIVNGRIAALAETTGDLDGDRREFTAMIPTGLLQLKDNQIEIARISGTEQAPALQRLRMTR